MNKNLVNNGRETATHTIMRILSAKSDLIDGYDIWGSDLTEEERQRVENVISKMVGISEDLVDAWSLLVGKERDQS